MDAEPLSVCPAPGQEETGDPCLCKTGMAGEVSRLLGALANDQRLMVIALLSEVEEMHVNDMVARLNVNRVSLSRHLARLRNLGAVTTRRHHNRVYYALNPGHAADIVAALKLGHARKS